MSNKTPGGPKYLPIYHRLRSRLESGELPIGALMPTEDQLCSDLNVSRYALREALGLLERHGFIQRRRRGGTRVLARTQSPKNVFRHATGSRSDFREFVRGTINNLGAPRLIQTDSKLARLLGCDELRHWYLLDGVRIDAVDRRPIGVSQTYVDASRATLPTDVDFSHRLIYEWLEEKFDIRTKIVSQDISAVALTAREAEIFGERPGAPSLRIVRRYFDEKDRIFEIAVTTHRSEDFIYNTQLHLEQ